MTVRVLFVCTGNVCRSPMAELFLRAREPHMHVESVGLRALVGEPVDASTGAVIDRAGVDPSEHRARQFERSMATTSDLVLTAERMHRDEILTETPTLYRRVFTMKEFARLAAPSDGLPAVDAVAAVAARRGRVEPPRGAEDDIVDPFRGTLAQAEAVAAEVNAVLDVLIRTLGTAN